MTPEERHQQMVERNKRICDYYVAGHSLKECSSHFRLGRQRTQQILEAGGVWKPYVKSNRTSHFRATITDETRAALEAKAKANGVSMSKFASDVLDAAVADAVVNE